MCLSASPRKSSREPLVPDEHHQDTPTQPSEHDQNLNSEELEAAGEALVREALETKMPYHSKLPVTSKDSWKKGAPGAIGGALAGGGICMIDLVMRMQGSSPMNLRARVLFMLLGIAVASLSGGIATLTDSGSPKNKFAAGVYAGLWAVGPPTVWLWF